MVIALFGIIYSLTKQPVSAPTINDGQKASLEEQSTIQQVPSTIIKYQGVEGQTALELLKTSHNVETKEFSGVGEFVVSIDGITPNQQTHFWAFYINGAQAQVGAGTYITKFTDVIEWKLEIVNSNK